MTGLGGGGGLVQGVLSSFFACIVMNVARNSRLHSEASKIVFAFGPRRLGLGDETHEECYFYSAVLFHQ